MSFPDEGYPECEAIVGVLNKAKTSLYECLCLWKYSRSIEILGGYFKTAMAASWMNTLCESGHSIRY